MLSFQIDFDLDAMHGFQIDFDLDAMHGPATTEIDSPLLRDRRRLNRRANLILSQSPSTDGNA
jgi:hypothetical protein